jgi:hypothetical protein
MRKIFKEPLLHFILIGAAFFLLYQVVKSDDSSEDFITIDESDLDEIVSKFEMQWKRPPTEEELTAILESRVEQEIFYQEALKMNLDHNDEIIKRRLSQKMQFLSNDISSLVEPTSEELKEYYQNNLDRFMQDATYSLYQIFFSPDLREDWHGDAKMALEDFNGLALEEALKKGDRIALPQYFENTSSFHIQRQMGDEFTKGLIDLKVGKWQGPIRSGYGEHLVFIEKKEAEQSAPFEEVKSKVLEDFNFEKQKEVKASIYDEFKSSYKVEIDVQSDAYPDEFIEKLKVDIEGA